MPGKIKVKVLAGRNLPVMDRASDTTDAFVEIRFGSITHKTDVCRKSLNPHWNSTEWYRFEVDESELQDEPLQLRLMDHDTYSANDAIGKVVISLAPLLAREANNHKGITTPPTGAVMSGWIPVFDTMHGIRGELNVIVKVELFSDFNKYKTSSCGVQFFHCSMIPPGYRATTIHGFVEELVVNDDPEYQWIDKIRTPRASNEARQVAFIKLSNQVQRLVGLKAAELGANAVVGYQQDFDLEGEAGVVARAIGTAVSITALPTPSEPICIPPCTQQQLKKYLDILATDAESITDLNQYFQNHQEELHKLLNILNPTTSDLLDDSENVDDDDKSLDLTRQSSVKSYVGNISIYQDEYVSQKSLKHISDDQTDLNKLLKRNEDTDSDSTGTLQKIKKIKTNFFKKRFGSMRSRKFDKQDDNISLKSNSSETSRISLTDIKNEFKKFKKLTKPKFRKTFSNKEDEGIGMASILARSVIHAHTSLACIAETQDSEHSPCSTMRPTSESEPTINLSDEDKTRIITTESMVETKCHQSESKTNVPEIHTSLKNLSIEKTDVQIPHRKISGSCPTSPMTSRSENLLKLPGETGYFGSLSLSGDSSEIYSSSDEDDDSSDQKTDTEKSVETTSSVVQSVLSQGVTSLFTPLIEKNNSASESVTSEANVLMFKAVIEKELIPKQNNVVSKSSTSLPNVHEIENNKNEKIEGSNGTNMDQVSTSAEMNKNTFVATKVNNNHHFKFHIPFAHKKVSKSISAPSSPVEKAGFMYRSSTRIKRQLSKISKNSMIKSLSHYSLIPKKKHVNNKVALSQPSSTSDVPSRVPSQTVLGSPFLSYADLLSLDKDVTDSRIPIYKNDDAGYSKVTMYIGSEPVSRASLSGPSSPYLKEEAHIYEQKSLRKDKTALKPIGLVHTAMETILMDKVQSLLVPTSPDPNQSKEKQFFDNINEKLEKVEESRNKYEEQYSSDEHLKVHTKGSSKEKNKKDSLVHTAIETILIDKVQSLLIPATPDLISSRENLLFYDVNTESGKQKEPRSKHPEYDIKYEHNSKHLRELTTPKYGKEKKDSLINTAMKTILMDKIQPFIPTSAEHINCKERQSENLDGINLDSQRNNHESLLHTAMETILMDKIQSMLPPTTPDIIQSRDNQLFSDVRDKEEIPRKPDSKVRDELNLQHTRISTTSEYEKQDNHTAMKTILMDKIQPLVPILAEPMNSEPRQLEVLENCNKNSAKNNNEGLLHSAIETILVDKVQSLLPPTTPNLIQTGDSSIVSDVNEKLQNLEQSTNKYTDSNIKHENNSKHVTELSKLNFGEETQDSLINTAVKTMLMDKVHTVIPTLTEPINSLEKQSVVLDEINQKLSKKYNEDLIHTAMETMLMDKVQSLRPPLSLEPSYSSANNMISNNETNDLNRNQKATSTDNNTWTDTAVDTILIDNVQSLITPTSSSSYDVNEIHFLNFEGQPKTEKSEVAYINDKKDKKLIRQDSIHSVTETNEELLKMSKESNVNIVIQRKATRIKPVLQHFHPILSGAQLETIPSLPESSLDHTESLDVEGVERTCDCQSECKCQECDSETNIASVCDNSHAACRFDRNDREKEKIENDNGSPRHARHESCGGREPLVAVQPPPNPSLHSSSTPMGIHRRSSDSDLSITPKGSSLNASNGNAGSGGGAILRPSMNSNNLELLEYPFLTMTEYPTGFIVHIGGTVCSRSVKLVDGGGESAVRAAWWAELRTELRAHARALRCNAVIAYTEGAAICEDVCVLSASGTAAVINLDSGLTFSGDTSTSALNLSNNTCEEPETDVCSMAHVPYSPGAGQYRAELSTCGGCRKSRVPAVLLATCAKPNKLPCYPKAVTLTAVAARLRRAPPASEPGARDISDQLPFLEYELHKLLIAKLRMQGANAVFGLQTQIAIGERCVMALASGTAMRLMALPPPTPPRIKASETDKNALDIQKALWDSFTANKLANGYDNGTMDNTSICALPEVEGEELLPALDLCADKDACVLELDEAEDVDTAKALAVRRMHIQVFTNKLKAAPIAPPHAFAQVWRARLTIPGQGTGASIAAERHVARALDGVTYKLRRLQPCALVAPRFHIELPEDEIQLVVSGAAIPLADPNKPEHSDVSDPTSRSPSHSHISNSNSHSNSLSSNGHSHSRSRSSDTSQCTSTNNQGNATGDADDDIFTLDEEQLVKQTPPSEAIDEKNLIINGQIPSTVSLTSLSYVSGSRAARRICALRLLFVRETTAVRELGGLSGFLHTFTCEVLAIVRAYTAALGGNTLTSFYITQLMLQDNAHKNQGQCLLSVGGDVVQITY